MRVNHPRQRDPLIPFAFAERNQQRGPNGSVEPENIFRNEVRRAALPITSAVRCIHKRQIVEQRIDPDINSLLRVGGKRNAPAAGSTATDGHIIHFADAGDDFIFSRRGLNIEEQRTILAFEPTLRVLIIEQPQQVIAVAFEFEKVILLAFSHQRLAIDRRLETVFLCFGIGDIFFLASVVPAFVSAFIDIAGFE